MASIVKTLDILHRVGKGGENLPIDVKTVVRMLTTVPLNDGGTNPLSAVPGIHLETAIRRFQLYQFACSNGRIEAGGVTIERLNKYYYQQQGFQPPFILDPPLPQAFNADALRAIRAALQDEVLRVAEAQLGKVSANNANYFGLPKYTLADGKTQIIQKKGWTFLKQYLDETVIDGQFTERDIVEAGSKPGGKSWCGVFAFWCINNAAKNLGGTADFGWSLSMGGPIKKGGSSKPNTKLSFINGNRWIQKGHVCVVDEKDANGRFEVHHVIPAETSADNKVATIEGNYYDRATKTNQSIVRNTRTLKEIVGYWDWFAPESL